MMASTSTSPSAGQLDHAVVRPQLDEAARGQRAELARATVRRTANARGTARLCRESRNGCNVVSAIFTARASCAFGREPRRRPERDPARLDGFDVALRVDVGDRLRRAAARAAAQPDRDLGLLLVLVDHDGLPLLRPEAVAREVHRRVLGVPGRAQAVGEQLPHLVLLAERRPAVAVAHQLVPVGRQLPRGRLLAGDAGAGVAVGRQVQLRAHHRRDLVLQHDVQVAADAVEGLVEQAVHQVDADPVEPGALRVADEVHAHLRTVLTPAQLQHVVVEGLHAAGQLGAAQVRAAGRAWPG